MTNQDYVELLRQIRTPILYDAMEKFNVRPRTEGLMDTSIRPLLPSLGVMTGYATTAKVVGALPPADGERIISPREVWQYVQRSPEPERHGCPRPRPTGGAKLCLGRRCREHLLAARVRRGNHQRRGA